MIHNDTEMECILNQPPKSGSSFTIVYFESIDFYLKYSNTKSALSLLENKLKEGKTLAVFTCTNGG